VKRAVVGFGRAEKHQIQQMVKLLLGLDAVPTPHDAADALAIAICHLHSATGPIAAERRRAWPPRGCGAGGSTGPGAAAHDRALRGVVAEKAPSRLIVDVQGVGYDVLVPLSTFYVAGTRGPR
jgi:hypothetical protein